MYTKNIFLAISRMVPCAVASGCQLPARVMTTRMVQYAVLYHTTYTTVPVYSKRRGPRNDSITY
jgi:hypothetical protein